METYRCCGCLGELGKAPEAELFCLTPQAYIVSSRPPREESRMQRLLAHPPIPTVKARSFQSRPEKSGRSRSAYLPTASATTSLLPIKSP
jgi:hypothetical protein